MPVKKKGLFDKRGRELQILVTGSARLDYYRRGGDSLQGRYHFCRLLPLTCAELDINSKSIVKDLMIYSGFPIRLKGFRLRGNKP